MRLRLLDNLFGFDRDETPGEVLFFRIFELFVAVSTVKWAVDWGFYMLRISDVVLPLGIAQYVDISFMYAGPFGLANAGLIAALAALGFLRVTRWAYLGAFVLLHLQYAARYSLGEIPHSANVLGLTLLGLGIGMAAFHVATQQRRFTMGFAYFFVPLGYTSAAACKLIGTGWWWSDGRHLWMWINEKGIDAFAKTGVLDFNWMQAMALDEWWMATAFLTIGLVSEAGAFLMWWRRFRLPVGLAVIGLHMGIWATMGILFLITTLELVLLTFPWAMWLDYVLPRLTLDGLSPATRRWGLGLSTG